MSKVGTTRIQREPDIGAVLVTLWKALILEVEREFPANNIGGLLDGHLRIGINRLHATIAGPNDSAEPENARSAGPSSKGDTDASKEHISRTSVDARELANLATIAMVYYFQFRRPNWQGPPLLFAFKPDPGSRSDHLALAIRRVANFVLRDHYTEAMRAIHDHLQQAHASLAGILNEFDQGDASLPLFFGPDGAKLVETLAGANRAVQHMCTSFEHEARSEFWGTVLGDRALTTPRDKSWWQLDVIERKRQAIISTRELLFLAFDSNREVESLIEDADGGSLRDRIERVRAQRLRFVNTGKR